MGEPREQRGTKEIAPASYEMKLVTSSRVTWCVCGKMQSSFSPVHLQHVQFMQAGKFKCSTFSGMRGRWQGASCCHTDGARLQSKAAASLQLVPKSCGGSALGGAGPAGFSSPAEGQCSGGAGWGG